MIKDVNKVCKEILDKYYYKDYDKNHNKIEFIVKEHLKELNIENLNININDTNINKEYKVFKNLCNTIHNIINDMISDIVVNIKMIDDIN